MTVPLSVLDPVPISSGFTAAQALEAAVQLARTAEQAGYVRVWYAEHHVPGAAACPAPAVLVSAVAAETRRLRVGSGGVVLRHHSPWHVAETYAMLDALYPDRIDLGVAGGVGASDATAAALQAGSGTYEERVVALDGALRTLGAQPQGWVLGSGPGSAALAARLGWRYASGNVTGPPDLLAQHRAAHTGRPYVALAVPVVCADTTAEALRLAGSHRTYFRSQEQAPQGTPVPPPGQPGPYGVLDLYPRLVVGDPVTVRAALTALQARYAADELVLLTVLHDQEVRRHSYTLIAQAMHARPAAPTRPTAPTQPATPPRPAPPAGASGGYA